MKKIVFLEGLPGVGKTTITNTIKQMNIPQVFTVDEIIKDITNKIAIDQSEFMENDEMKISKYNEGLIVVDRGPISTLSYNMTRSLIDNKFDSSQVMNWFNQFVSLLGSDNVKIVYLTTNNQDYYLPFENDMDPYGSIKNQRLLESTSIANCKRYAKNLQIIEYHKSNMEDIINEIVN